MEELSPAALDAWAEEPFSSDWEEDNWTEEERNWDDDEPEEEEDDRIYSVQFPLELNSATQEQLMFIPKVGNVTSQRIVQYREHLGGYTSLEQLMEIKGIGQGTYDQIAPYLYLEGEWEPGG